MIRATFDVHGKDVDTILRNGRAIADELVGDREYTIGMVEISKRVGVYGEDRPLDWVAEFEIETDGDRSV